MTAKDETITPINLDDVHVQAVHELETNPEPKVEEPKIEEPKVPEPKVEPKIEEPKVPEPIKPEPVIQPTLLDTDITKEGKGKIAIKNSDGVMNYFNNLDEIPDDFEPSNYKDFTKFNVEMADKIQSDKVTARENETAQKQVENQKEIDTLISTWDKDIEVLTKGGVLPEDKAARDTEIGDTYTYISKKTSEGVIVDSFAEAHKAMMYDKLKDAEKIVNDAKNQVTKDKGSKVMGSSGASSGKSPEALPAGVTLDQVHAKYSGLI